MYGNVVSTQAKGRAFVTKVQVCVGTPISFWLGTFGTIVCPRCYVSHALS